MSHKNPHIPVGEKLAFTINEAIALSSLSRTTLYKLIARGELKTVLVAGRRLVPREALHLLLQPNAA
jgi:excisionase family DNA binding protein